LKATSKARRLEEHTKKNVFFYGVERFLLRVFRGFVVAFSGEAQLLHILLSRARDARLKALRYTGTTAHPSTGSG